MIDINLLTSITSITAIRSLIQNGQILDVVTLMQLDFYICE